MTAVIKIADLSSPAFISLVNTHKATMLEHSPPESSHALLIDGLRAPGIDVWSLFDADDLIGCGALKIFAAGLGEIKSMHVLASRRGAGLGQLMLSHLMNEARRRDLHSLWLETGAQPGFMPARKLYEANGFTYCGAFGDYKADPNSVFMSRELRTDA